MLASGQRVFVSLATRRCKSPAGHREFPAGGSLGRGRLAPSPRSAHPGRDRGQVVCDRGPVDRSHHPSLTSVPAARHPEAMFEACDARFTPRTPRAPAAKPPLPLVVDPLPGAEAGFRYHRVMDAERPHPPLAVRGIEAAINRHESGRPPKDATVPFDRRHEHRLAATRVVRDLGALPPDAILYLLAQSLLDLASDHLMRDRDLTMRYEERFEVEDSDEWSAAMAEYNREADAITAATFRAQAEAAGLWLPRATDLVAGGASRLK